MSIHTERPRCASLCLHCASLRYFHRVSKSEYEPLATCKAGLKIELEARGLRWCPECKAAVSPVQGSIIFSEDFLCPFHYCYSLSADDLEGDRLTHAEKASLEDPVQGLARDRECGCCGYLGSGWHFIGNQDRSEFGLSTLGLYNCPRCGSSRAFEPKAENTDRRRL